MTTWALGRGLWKAERSNQKKEEEKKERIIKVGFGTTNPMVMESRLNDRAHLGGDDPSGSPRRGESHAFDLCPSLKPKTSRPTGFWNKIGSREKKS